MSDGNETTTKFNVDISQLKKGIQDAKRQISLANSEFKASSSALENWASSTEGVAAKLKQLDTTLKSQETILDNLKAQYKQVAEEQGEGSAGAERLKIAINNQQSAINKTKNEIDKYNDVLAELEDGSGDVEKDSEKASKGVEKLGDSAEKAESKTLKLAKTLGGVLKKGLAGIVTAGAGAVTAFLASGEATQEYTEDMGKLEAGFKSAGHSAKAAEKSYRGMVGILGETDQSVEAVNHLAKLTKNQKELSKWTNIAAGVYGTFGDSLPIEGLTEAANETAKVGQVTGPLADALNWAGISEDDFNKKLAKCNSEKERSTLITETLNKTYKKAASIYKKTNKDLIKARRATADMNGTMAEMGKMATPITTALKKGFTDVLKSMLPDIKNLSSGFLDLTNGVDGADKKIGNAVGKILTNILNRIVEAAPELTSVGMYLITSLLTGIIASSPELATAASTILNTVMDGLVSAGPELIATAAVLLESIANGIIRGAPELIKIGSQMLTMLGEGIKDNLPNLVSEGLDVLDGFADFLTENVPKLLDVGILFITNLVAGVMSSLPTFIEKAPEIITKFANLINDNMPKLLNAGINIIIMIAKGLISAIPVLVKNAPKIITAIVAVWNAFDWLNLGKRSMLHLKDGILKTVGQVKNAGKNVLQGITGTLKGLPDEMAGFGKTGITKLAVAFGGGISTVKGKAVEILKSIVASFKPSSLKEVGGNLIKGLWQGMSDKFGWLTGQIKGFANDVTSKLKKFFGIHSPSRVMRDQVGKYISLGIAEGIKNNEKSVTDTVTNLGKHVLSALKKNMKEQEFKKIGSNLVSKLTSGINSKVSKFDDTISKIADKYDKLIEDVKNKQETLSATFAKMGDGLYTKDDSGNIVLSDLKEQTKEIEAYGKNLKKLKGKISETLMNEILAMDANEGYEYTKALLALSDEKLKAYNKAYTQKISKSNKLAKAWYKADIAKLKSQYTDKVSKVIKKMVNDVSNAGTDALHGFLKAFNGNKEIEKSFNSFCNRVVKTIKKKFKIHSPSRVMRDEVGKYLSLGIAEGVTRNKDAVNKALSSVAEPLDFGLSNAKSRVVSHYTANGANRANTSTNNTYTFNQYNNSPKALSRLEIYRQTRNQLNFAKGV